MRFFVLLIFFFNFLFFCDFLIFFVILFYFLCLRFLITDADFQSSGTIFEYRYRFPVVRNFFITDADFDFSDDCEEERGSRDLSNLQDSKKGSHGRKNM